MSINICFWILGLNFTTTFKTAAKDYWRRVFKNIVITLSVKSTRLSPQNNLLWLSIKTINLCQKTTDSLSRYYLWVGPKMTYITALFSGAKSFQNLVHETKTTMPFFGTSGVTLVNERHKTLINQGPKSTIYKNTSVTPILCVYRFISLHIRSMWETICDALASWSGWEFGSKIQVYPILGFGSQNTSFDLPSFPPANSAPRRYVETNICIPRGYRLVDKVEQPIQLPFTCNIASQ